MFNYEDFEKKLDFIKGSIEQIVSIGMLEYHDKNWLSMNNKTRNEAKRELLISALDKLEELKLQLYRD